MIKSKVGNTEHERGIVLWRCTRSGPMPGGPIYGTSDPEYRPLPLWFTDQVLSGGLYFNFRLIYLYLLDTPYICFILCGNYLLMGHRHIKYRRNDNTSARFRFKNVIPQRLACFFISCLSAKFVKRLSIESDGSCL